MDFNIVCVHKGGVFSWDYVLNLYYMTTKSFTRYPFKFVCFTNTVSKETLVERKKGSLFLAIPFHFQLRKWWSKLEAFRLVGTVIYFDLDITILRNLDWTSKKFVKVHKDMLEGGEGNRFYMLKLYQMNHSWSSTIMAWVGDYSWLANDFSDYYQSKYDWEQIYISSELENKGHKINVVQSLFRNNIYYHRYAMLGDRIKGDAEILYYHGRPKPHELGGMFFPLEEARKKGEVA